MLNDTHFLHRRAKPPPSSAEDAVPSEGAVEGENSKKLIPPPTDRAGRSTDNSIASSRETLVDDGGGGGGAGNGAGEGGGGSPVHAGIVVGGIAAVIKEALAYPGGRESPHVCCLKNVLSIRFNQLDLMPSLQVFCPLKARYTCFFSLSLRFASPPQILSYALDCFH